MAERRGSRAILDELPRRPMLAGKDGLRLSLAGAQDKLPVVFDGAHIGLPLNGTPSSHILKSAIHAVEDSVINEGSCMVLAEAMQLKQRSQKFMQYWIAHSCWLSATTESWMFQDTGNALIQNDYPPNDYPPLKIHQNN